MLRKYLVGAIATVPQDGWVLMSREPDHLLFGRRTGPIGIVQTVSFDRDDAGAWQNDWYGACDGVLGAGGRPAERVGAYREQDGGLVLLWRGGSCYGDDSPQRADVQVRETPAQVSVLVVPVPRADSEEPCMGLDLPEESRVRLTQPLGDRTVVDAGVVGDPVVGEQGALEQAAEARRAAAAAAQNQADAFCAEGAVTLGGAPKISFVSSYRDVHAALPDLPWEPLPADAAAAQCMVVAPDGSIAAAVYRPGYPAFVYARQVQEQHLYDRLTP